MVSTNKPDRETLNTDIFETIIYITKNKKMLHTSERTNNDMV